MEEFDKALDLALDNRLKCYSLLCNPYTGKRLETLRDVLNIRLPLNDEETKKYVEVIRRIIECDKQFPLPKSLFEPP